MPILEFLQGKSESN